MPQCSVRKFCKAKNRFADIQLLGLGATDARTQDNAALSAPRSIKSRKFLEEAKLLWAVADQQILGLLIVVEHHLVGFAPDT